MEFDTTLVLVMMMKGHNYPDWVICGCNGRLVIANNQFFVAPLFLWVSLVDYSARVASIAGWWVTRPGWPDQPCGGCCGQVHPHQHLGQAVHLPHLVGVRGIAGWMTIRCTWSRLGRSWNTFSPAHALRKVVIFIIIIVIILYHPTKYAIGGKYHYKVNCLLIL